MRGTLPQVHFALQGGAIRLKNSVIAWGLQTIRFVWMDRPLAVADLGTDRRRRVHHGWLWNAREVEPSAVGEGRPATCRRR
jgi:hypothetical protein